MLACSRVVLSPRLLFFALVLPGCGARSGLLVGSGGASSGQGGAVAASSSKTGSTSTSTATSTSTSTGGPKKICYGLISSGAPILTTDSSAMQNEHRPLLVPAESGTVAVLIGEDALEGPTNIGSIRSAGFQPWGPWPSDLGSTHGVASAAGPTFTAARAYGDGKSGYEVLFVAEDLGTPPLLFLSNEIHTSQSYAPLPPGTPIPGGLVAKPLCFAPTANGRIEVNDSPQGANHLAIVHTPDMPPPTFPGASLPACGTVPLVGAGIAEPSNGAVGGPYALIALSNSYAEIGCHLPIKVPSKIVVDTWPSSGLPSPKTVIDNAAAVRQIELVPRSDGAWLVWQAEKAPGAASVPPVMATRVDALGKTIANTFEAVPAGQNGYPFAASAVGDELVVAFIESPDPTSKTNLGMRVFLPDGSPDGDAHLSVASLPTPPGGPWWVDTQGISLLGNNDSVILAWSEHATEPTAPGRVLVGRFTCAGPE